MLISLFLMELVGSLGIDLYVFWLSKLLALFMESCLSIITICYPLVCSEDYVVSVLFSSLKAKFWTLVKLGLGGWEDLRTLL